MNNAKDAILVILGIVLMFSALALPALGIAALWVENGTFLAKLAMSDLIVLVTVALVGSFVNETF
jgi:cytochrome c biogenesis protein CcdA